VTVCLYCNIRKGPRDYGGFEQSQAALTKLRDADRAFWLASLSKLAARIRPSETASH
jgi:hypothetical protein